MLSPKWEIRPHEGEIIVGEGTTDGKNRSWWVTTRKPWIEHMN